MYTHFTCKTRWSVVQAAAGAKNKITCTESEALEEIQQSEPKFMHPSWECLRPEGEGSWKGVIVRRLCRIWDTLEFGEMQSRAKNDFYIYFILLFYIYLYSLTLSLSIFFDLCLFQFLPLYRIFWGRRFAFKSKWIEGPVNPIPVSI